MNETARPHGSRRLHQQEMQRRHRRLRKQRYARVRRIRFLRGLRTARFWTRSGITLTALVCVAFWAKLAVVYDLPDYAQKGRLSGINAYVSVKDWWFGPPAFDVNQYLALGDRVTTDPYSVILEKMGRYQSVLLNPEFVWVSRSQP